MLYVTNGFSTNMIDWVKYPYLGFTINSLTPEQAQDIILTEKNWKSIVGHADTASIFNEIFSDIQIKTNRETVSLNVAHDKLLIGQYRGSRLPEGATSLPEGATIQWLYLTFS